MGKRHSKNRRSASVRYLFLLAVTILTLLLGGCSRGEDVKVVNDYDRPVRVRLFEDTTPVIGAGDSYVLPQRHYIGGSPVTVVILSRTGQVLKKADIDVPSDSLRRRFAVVNVSPLEERYKPRSNADSEPNLAGGIVGGIMISVASLAFVFKLYKIYSRKRNGDQTRYSVLDAVVVYPLPMAGGIWAIDTVQGGAVVQPLLLYVVLAGFAWFLAGFAERLGQRHWKQRDSLPNS